MEDDELTDRLDIATGNAYYGMQDGLLLPDPTPDDHQQVWKTTGVWALYQTADWMFSSRQEPFLVTETNAGSIGMPWDNRPAYDGQWRQAAWALVARGARMIEYWHWHTLHFGAETYWGGILPHTGQPGRTYAELARLGAEFEAAGPLVAGLEPDADITMVYSTPSKWLMKKYPPLAAPDGEPDPEAYHRIFDPFYRGAFDADRQVRIVHARQLHDPRGVGSPRPKAGGGPDTRGGRPPPPRPRRAGVVHRGRLDARLARGLRGSGRPSGPRTAHRLRRPRGPGPPGTGPRAAGGSRGRPVRRVQQPDARGPRHGRRPTGRSTCPRARRRPAGRTA